MLIRFSIGALVGIGRSVWVFLLGLVWRNRRSLVPETFRKKLAETFRSLAALSLRLILFIGPSGHVAVIVALCPRDRAARHLVANQIESARFAAQLSRASVMVG